MIINESTGGYASPKPSLTNTLMSKMSGTTRKPLPPALKALQPVLDTLPLEEDSEGETEVMNVKDFTVRAFYASLRMVADLWSGIRLVGNEGFLPQG